MASVSKVSILDYFNIVFEGENGKIESNCKACGTRIQAKRSVTSNFVTHLKVIVLKTSTRVGVRFTHADSLSWAQSMGGTLGMCSSHFAAQVKIVPIAVLIGSITG